MQILDGLIPLWTNFINQRAHARIETDGSNGDYVTARHRTYTRIGIST